MDEQTTSATQDNTAVAEKNDSVESATVQENVSTNTSTSEEAKSKSETKTESVEANKPNTEEKPSGAPEQYGDFTVPEGFSAPIDDFKSWAKENNMTQEAAQSAVDFYVNKIAPQQQAQHEEMVNKWVEESKSKFGDKGIEEANKALARFSTPEFINFLSETGIGNHPEMIAAFKNIGTKISESGWIDGQSTPANGPDYYPGLPQNKKMGR
jgi:hypothetical protein